MQIKPAPPIRKPLPLVPMVDVVFLLLMFFMLSSTFLKLGSFSFGMSGGNSTGATVPAVPGVIIRVGKGGRAAVNGTVVTLEALPAVLDEYVGRGVTRARLSAAPGVDVQDLVDALSAVRRSHMPDVSVGK